ncbi:SMC family ATPase, partial [bacterium]|nr:SMC family ATPase [bacterium]
QARTAEREKLFAKLMSEKKLAVKEHALELEALNKKRNELKIKLTDSNKNLEKLEGELRGCGALEKKQKDLLAGLEIFRKQFDKRREFYHWIVQQGNTLKNSSSALVHKTRAVNCDQGPTCPLCEQVLTARRKIFLGDKFSKEEYFLLHRLRRVTKIMPRLKKILIEQHKELEVQMAELEKTKLALLRVQDLEKKKSEETKNKTSIELELKKIVASEISLLKSNAASTKDIDDLILPAKKEAWLKEDEQLKAINIKFATLVKEIKTIDYNKNQHDATVEQLKQLESQCAIAKDTSAAKAEQMRRKNEILRLCEELKKSKASGLASKKAEEKIKKHNAEITKLDSEIETSSKNLAAVRSELEKVLQEVGRLDGMRTRLVALGKELKERRAEQSKEREELEGYEILSQAYGKNGIQALLIDSAIPEIENEANTILARLTGNRAQIFIESLRGLKKGGVKETLDIKISDSAGMRQYEMFSGGEAFRIDFSLRIAISKLLARRAGTALQTLVIDEGFGSQDEDGILQLTEALYSIRGDFEKVIIVSHLESMKEAFPTHFIVEKGPLGSVVRIEQRG